MLIYIITFILSCFFTFLAQKMFEIGKKHIGILVSIFAIILPALIAGLRDLTIGTDTSTYVRYFNLARESNNFFEYNNTSRLEVGFNLLTFITSRISDNYNVFLFIIALLIIIPIYIRAYETRRENSMTLTMMVAYLLIFNMSLNICRQCIAMAIIVYGWKYVENKNLIKYCIIVIIAMTFHITAIVALPIYFIFWIVQTKHKGTGKILIISGVLIFIIGLVTISQLLIDYGVLPNNYSNYLNIDTASSIDIKQILLRLPFFIIVLLGYKKLKKENEFFESYFILMIVELIITLSGRKYQLLNRISYFYLIPIYICTLPFLKKAFKNDKLNHFFYNLLCIGVLFIYWYYTTVYIGYYSTVPYVSQII